jgi:2-polyprenyl-3-methyl-5-hydroxy-6-metoxy-1,4-benzoquinol methylase
LDKNSAFILHSLAAFWYLALPYQKEAFMHSCPLCHHSESQPYYRDKRRRYHQCPTCHLVWVEESDRLDAQAEKSMYDLHENDPSDDGYRKFLSRFATPLLEKISANSHGIDFGCGPGPTLSGMVEEQGHHVALYDIFYYPDETVLRSQYDFVMATEVIEHLHHPDEVWHQWLSMLKPGGWLGVMTKQVINKDAFAQWHYKNDLTHVSFFSRETFHYLAERDNLAIEFIGNDVILLRKPQ